MSDQKFLWLDVETSGLHPETNKLLEIAVVATDTKLNVLAEYQAVIKCDNFDDMDDFVKKMHTDNGLIEECKRAEKDLNQVEEDLIVLVKGLQTTQKPIVAGNSVHFDKYFIRKHMGNLDQLIHYRILDVSTLKEMMRNFMGIQIPKDQSAHRALNDVHASLEEFRRYSSILKVDMLGY